MKNHSLSQYRLIIIALISLGVFSTIKLQAAEGGLSNYIPGFYGDLALALEPADGFAFRNDTYYFSGNIGGSVRSGNLEVDADVKLLNSYLTFFYKPEEEILGSSMAFSITPSISSTDIDGALSLGSFSSSFDDSEVGLGDTTFGMYFYWNYEKFHFSLNNYIVTPTGDYDENELANTGLNYWTFESDIAITYLNETTGQDYSIVMGYGYNTENKDTNYKSGDEIHLDFVLNQHFSEQFGIGLNGYLYKQIGADSGSGAILGSFKGEAFGLGPAIYYNQKIGGNDVYFILKWIHDFHTENRVDGDTVYASVMFAF